MNDHDTTAPSSTSFAVSLTKIELLVINRMRTVAAQGRGTIEVKIENGKVVDVVFSHREDHERLRVTQQGG